MSRLLKHTKRNYLSLIVCFLICSVLVFYRFSHSEQGSKHTPLKVTTWDALGYYIYLPSILIYQDMTELEWLPKIEEQYSVTGGKLYQADKYENGNYVFKYLGGVAVLEIPFFLIGHAIAKNTGYKADGFSPPYQYAIGYGAVLYCILAFFLLRHMLLKFFSDQTTAITLLLLVLATNLIQYVSVDSGMSHAYIFPLYVLVLFTTIKWHAKPGALWAALTGLIIGVATICRPTEAIMLFIPLLWNTHTKEARREKWELVRKHWKHVLFAVGFGFIGVLPQLIYWKIASGSFVYNVGSKWAFLDPFFRVLFGWTNGWFIYTPITVLFVAGFFFIRRFPFRNAVITFCLLNIWIVIAWFDWKYGATYSTRALVQSYPVFAFPFAAIIERITRTKWRYVFFPVALYLIYVNIFQLNQYSKTILHFRDMNRDYYARIYLNPHPSPLDMSLLDTDEFLNSEKGYNKQLILSSDSTIKVRSANEAPAIIAKTVINQQSSDPTNTDYWLRVTTNIKVEQGFSGSYIHAELESNDSIKHTRIRLFSPLSQPGNTNNYDFYVRIPEGFDSPTIRLYISSASTLVGIIEKLGVYYLRKQF